MQKFLIINTNLITYGQKPFLESEYPEVSKLLDEGYRIKQITPITTSESKFSYALAIVFERD